jgi:K+ transporter
MSDKGAVEIMDDNWWWPRLPFITIAIGLIIVGITWLENNGYLPINSSWAAVSVVTILAITWLMWAINPPPGN